MPAYIIVIRKTPIRDEQAMAEYQQRTRALTGQFNVVPRAVYGATERLEGEAPDGVIVLEFPSMEEARAFYYNDEYQAAVPFRKLAADHDMFIVEGL